MYIHEEVDYPKKYIFIYKEKYNHVHVCIQSYIYTVMLLVNAKLYNLPRS